MERVAIAHDYLTQRGGAERVVLSMARTFPSASVYTSLYEPGGTFPEFLGLDVHPSSLNSVGALRRHHRLALPLLAPSFSRLQIDAEVTICSSSGWAHGAHVTGRKIVYCYAPARWLYQPSRYLRSAKPHVRTLFRAMRGPLETWDRRAAATVDRYLANSSWIASEIKRVYGIDAEVVHSPVTLDAAGERQRVQGIEPGFALCVSRLLPYKNVDAVVQAFDELPAERLVVVGEGPDADRLQALANPRVRFLSFVTDEELRWLYATSAYLVTASYEDFGLTPLEGALFGRPTAALRFGGFLDTVRERETGMFFDQPAPASITAAVRALRAQEWDEQELRRHGAAFSEPEFADRLRDIVDEERSQYGEAPVRPVPQPVPAPAGAHVSATQEPRAPRLTQSGGIAQLLPKRLRAPRPAARDRVPAKR